jgi:hypothetical protein
VGHLNAFLKSEKLGISDTDCPNYRQPVATRCAVIGKRLHGYESLRERAIKRIYSKEGAA